jgi:hypothetical protein
VVVGGILDNEDAEEAFEMICGADITDRASHESDIVGACLEMAHSDLTVVLKLLVDHYTTCTMNG